MFSLYGRNYVSSLGFDYSKLLEEIVMLLREEMDAFFEWLDGATHKERVSRHEEIAGDLPFITSSWHRGDAYFMLRHIEIHLMGEIQLNRNLPTVKEKLQATRELLFKSKDRRAIYQIKDYIRKLEMRILKGER